MPAAAPRPALALYRVCGEAGKEGTPGAPRLYFQLLVNTQTGKITGHARQIQAVAPPYDNIPITITSGTIVPLTVGNFIQVVSLQGTGLISFPPPLILEILQPFEAHFVTDKQWEGVASWTLGNTNVNDVPIKKFECLE